MKTILEVNSNNYASTGNIMLNIAKQARKRGFKVYTCCRKSRAGLKFKYEDQIYIGTWLDRVISDNGHVYEYRGDSDIRKKTWFKWGSTFYKYDENGNLVSEKYNKGAQRYNMEIEYDEDGYPVSAGKEYPNDEKERKETRTYSYETF